MSKPRKRAFLATKLFFIVTIFLCYIHIVASKLELDDLIEWIPIFLLYLLDIGLFILSIIGWLNIDIFKKLGMKKRPSGKII